MFCDFLLKLLNVLIRVRRLDIVSNVWIMKDASSLVCKVKVEFAVGDFVWGHSVHLGAHTGLRDTRTLRVGLHVRVRRFLMISLNCVILYIS